MDKSALSVVWVLTLVTSVVMLAISAGAVVLAALSPAGSTSQLDAWRGAAVSILALLASSTLLAVLTAARLRRGEALVDEVVDAEVPAAAPVIVEQDIRPL